MKLSDTQCLILSAAAQRAGNIALPLPPSLRGGAAKKVVTGLLSRGLVAEVEAGREDPVWRETDGSTVTLVATAAGLEAIGVEAEAPEAEVPEPAPEGAAEAAEQEPAPEAGTTAELAATAAQAGDGPKVRAGTKQAHLIDMLRSPEGAALARDARRDDPRRRARALRRGDALVAVGILAHLRPDHRRGPDRAARPAALPDGPRRRRHPARRRRARRPALGGRSRPGRAERCRHPSGALPRRHGGLAAGAARLRRRRHLHGRARAASRRARPDPRDDRDRRYPCRTAGGPSDQRRSRDGAP